MQHSKFENWRIGGLDNSIFYVTNRADDRNLTYHRITFVVQVHGFSRYADIYWLILLGYGDKSCSNWSCQTLMDIIGDLNIQTLVPYHINCKIQAFLHFCSFDFHYFRFTVDYNIILLFFPLVLQSNLDLLGFCFPRFLCVSTLTA